MIIRLFKKELVTLLTIVTYLILTFPSHSSNFLNSQRLKKEENSKYTHENSNDGSKRLDNIIREKREAPLASSVKNDHSAF